MQCDGGGGEGLPDDAVGGIGHRVGDRGELPGPVQVHGQSRGL